MMKPRNNGDETREDGMPVGRPFAAGNPGRPKGSRNKLGEAFLDAMHEDFNAHGKDVIERVRIEKPDQYLKVVASILPKDLNVNINNMDEMTDEELLERLRQLDAVVRPFIDPEGVRDHRAGAGPAQTH